MLSESAAVAAEVPFAGGDGITWCADGMDSGRAGGRGGTSMGREWPALDGAWGAAGASGMSSVAAGDASRLCPMIAR